MFRPAAGLEDTPNEETTSVVHVDVTKNVETSCILPATAVGHAVPDPTPPFSQPPPTLLENNIWIAEGALPWVFQVDLVERKV